jgi:hypothetical protein
MKIENLYSHNRNLPNKFAFLIRVFAILAIGGALLITIAKIRIAARNYHEKQQTISQKQIH